jgi:hypothetical protein
MPAPACKTGAMRQAPASRYTFPDLNPEIPIQCAWVQVPGQDFINRAIP